MAAPSTLEEGSPRGTAVWIVVAGANGSAVGAVARELALHERGCPDSDDEAPAAAGEVPQVTQGSALGADGNTVPLRVVEFALREPELLPARPAVLAPDAAQSLSFLGSVRSGSADDQLQVVLQCSECTRLIQQERVRALQDCESRRLHHQRLFDLVFERRASAEALRDAARGYSAAQGRLRRLELQPEALLREHLLQLGQDLLIPDGPQSRHTCPAARLAEHAARAGRAAQGGVARHLALLGAVPGLRVHAVVLVCGPQDTAAELAARLTALQQVFGAPMWHRLGVLCAGEGCGEGSAARDDLRGKMAAAFRSMGDSCLKKTPDGLVPAVRAYAASIGPDGWVHPQQSDIRALLQWAADCAAGLRPLDGPAVARTDSATGATFRVCPPTDGERAELAARGAGLVWDAGKRALTGRLGVNVQHDALRGVSKLRFDEDDGSNVQAWFPTEFLRERESDVPPRCALQGHVVLLDDRGEGMDCCSCCRRWLWWDRFGCQQCCVTLCRRCAAIPSPPSPPSPNRLGIEERGPIPIMARVLDVGPGAEDVVPRRLQLLKVLRVRRPTGPSQVLMSEVVRMGAGDDEAFCCPKHHVEPVLEVTNDPPEKGLEGRWLCGLGDVLGFQLLVIGRDARGRLTLRIEAEAEEDILLQVAGKTDWHAMPYIWVFHSSSGYWNPISDSDSDLLERAYDGTYKSFATSSIGLDSFNPRGEEMSVRMYPPGMHRNRTSHRKAYGDSCSRATIEAGGETSLYVHVDRVPVPFVPDFVMRRDSPPRPLYVRRTSARLLQLAEVVDGRLLQNCAVACPAAELQPSWRARLAPTVRLAT
eukprot:TRINITY_DN15677_c0_g1_i3.p1 TRINITY_DN15677_c0_g1~~TRINITY_DN15677_c0_g1_i3.p1  ORF type:complete len:846 (+),score=225.60 TRINITY_DN15677_c0_g1_i3:77-2539(+)